MQQNLSPGSSYTPCNRTSAPVPPTPYPTEPQPRFLLLSIQQNLSPGSSYTPCNRTSTQDPPGPHATQPKSRFSSRLCMPPARHYPSLPPPPPPAPPMALLHPEGGARSKPPPLTLAPPTCLQPSHPPILTSHLAVGPSCRPALMRLHSHLSHPHAEESSSVFRC